MWDGASKEALGTPCIPPWVLSDLVGRVEPAIQVLRGNHLSSSFSHAPFSLFLSPFLFFPLSGFSVPLHPLSIHVPLSVAATRIPDILEMGLGVCCITPIREGPYFRTVGC